MVELSYKEKNGLLYPLLETGSMMEETESMSLGRYGKLAEEYLKVKDKSRYSLLLRTGKLQETLKQIEEEAWDLHDQIVESYVKMKAADRKINDSPGDRDSGGYLQTEITDINDSDVKEGTAVAVPSFSSIPAEISEELRIELLLAGTSEPMARQKIYHFFELNEGLRDRARYLCQMYEAGDTISTEAGHVFRYETDEAGIQLYWHENGQYLSGYLPFEVAAEEILHLIDRGKYYQPIKTDMEIPQPLVDTVENFEDSQLQRECERGRWQGDF